MKKTELEILREERNVAVAALKQISFYSRINHDKFKDYGEVADRTLMVLGEKTGEL